MAAQSGLVTYGSSVSAGMVTVREEGVGLSLSWHKHISSLLMTGSVILLLKLLSAVYTELWRHVLQPWTNNVPSLATVN